MQTDKHSSNAGGSAGNKVNQAVSQASAASHDTIDRAQDAVRPAVDAAAEKAHQTVDRVASSATKASKTLERKGEQLWDAQEQALDQVRAYVNEHPIAALSMAVAGGFLLSRILSAR